MPHVVRVSRIVALVLIALVAAVIAHPALAQEFDPASILGEWSGRHAAPTGPGWARSRSAGW